MTAPKVVYKTDEGDTLYRICLKYYGRLGDAYTAILQANPELAWRKLCLPRGVEIVLPEMPEETKAENRRVKRKQLWSNA